MTSRGYDIAIGAVLVAIVAALVWQYHAAIGSGMVVTVVVVVVVLAGLLALFYVARRYAEQRKRRADLAEAMVEQRSTSVESADVASPEPPSIQAAAPVRPPVRPFDLGTGAGFTVGIVGESYRQTALRALAGGRRRRGEEVVCDVIVYAEPTNSHDPNAVRVDDASGRQLGYLSREDAAAYHQLFVTLAAAGRVGRCRAQLIGGTAAKPSIGVILDLEEQGELLARLRAEDQPF
jgi:hypothetical protein